MKIHPRPGACVIMEDHGRLRFEYWDIDMEGAIDPDMNDVLVEICRHLLRAALTEKASGHVRVSGMMVTGNS